MPGSAGYFRAAALRSSAARRGDATGATCRESRAATLWERLQPRRAAGARRRSSPRSRSAAAGRSHKEFSCLLLVTPTSALRRPCPRLLSLFSGARLQRTETRISSVTAHSQCQARHGLGPRGAPTPLAVARYRIVACRRDKPVGTHPPNLSGLNTFKVGSTRSLYTSPAHQADASTRPLPFAPQGSILGSRLTITPVGFPPTRLRDIAKPHCPPKSCQAALIPFPTPFPISTTPVARARS